MCGIAGKVTDGAPVERALLEQMCRALHHRGPDGEGTYVEGPVALGMRRLAIIDLVTGDQPLVSEDGQVTVVFNGEIYNHEPLRAELRGRGHSLSSGSDGEVIVHLWEELGPRCVERLRGMFAIAVWDARRRELFLARDRLGKKPLWYAVRDGALWFASEPRAILQDPAVPRDVDLRAVDAYLVNQYVPHDRSCFAALRKLPPASRLLWKPGGEPQVERYWRLEYEPKAPLREAEAAERVRELVLESTRLRLMSDVPIGAFLSGGVDSSGVVAAMAMTSAEPVRTFAAHFHGAPDDELRYARMVAERYGTDHRELEIGPADASVLPRLAWHYGEPFADPAALSTFQLSETMREHVTVALNGDGGDEAFAGYRRYWQIDFTRRFEALPAPLRRGVAAALTRAAGGIEGTAALPRAARLAHRLALHPARRYADLFRYVTDAQRAALYGPRLQAAVVGNDPLEHVVRAWDERPGLDWVDRLLATDLDTYLPDDLLAKVDVASMAASLEVRSPLLDHELMELAATLPVSMKARRPHGKLLLREALRPWLPDAVLDHPKRGFDAPVSRWLREQLSELPRDVLLDPAAQARGLFAPGAVERLMDEHAAGVDRGKQLWALVNLELWFRTCVDAAPAVPQDIPALA